MLYVHFQYITDIFYIVCCQQDQYYVQSQTAANPWHQEEEKKDRN